MTIIVEDGTAKADAESYVSVTDADTYHTARGNETTWTDLDTDVKEAALRKATDYMLQTYRGRWAGYRSTSTQALDWPRQGVPIPDVFLAGYGGEISNDIVPNEVKNACAELALRSRSADLLADEERAVISERVGPISVTYDSGSPQRTRYGAIDALLRPYLIRTGIMHKVERS